MTETYKSGFVSILGRPNAGKSTLLNALVGEKIAIISNKPQTTRVNIQAIKTGEDYQAIFIDTPGFHNAKDKINHMMVKQARDSVETVDIIYLIVEVNEKIGHEMKELLKLVEDSKAVKFLLINKVDASKKREDVYKTAQIFFEYYQFKHVLPISALKGTNVEKLLELTRDELPEGPQLFPADEITTQPEKLYIAEAVREQAFRQLMDEIPYQVLVETESVEDVSQNKMVISASIIVARDNHKGIVIGKQGQRLKEIGQASRFVLEKFFGVKIHLELFVKVRHNWTEDDESLRIQGLQ